MSSPRPRVEGLLWWSHTSTKTAASPSSTLWQSESLISLWDTGMVFSYRSVACLLPGCLVRPLVLPEPKHSLCQEVGGTGPRQSLPCASQALWKPISVTLEASAQVPVLTFPVFLWWLRKCCFHSGKLQSVITIERSCAFLFRKSPLLAEPLVSHRHSCFSDYWNFLLLRRKALSSTALLYERVLTAA